MTDSDTPRTPGTPEDAYAWQLRSLLRMAADDLDRAAADWDATAANQTLHTPPAVAQHAAATARAHRDAAHLVRAALWGLDAERTPEEDRPYTRGEILYVVTVGDAEGYLAGRLGEDVPAPVVADFARLVERTIDRTESWGELLQAACDVAYDDLLAESPDAAALHLSVLAAEAEAD